MPECVHCGEAHPLMRTHYRKKHPGKRFNPVLYWEADDA